MKATVLSVEPLGAETFVHLDTGGTTLRGRVAGFDAPRPGEQTTALVSPADLVWFDGESGERLDGAPESAR
jgi:ABC-type sugar transport system ATPase subunit